jgi:hypothetical protein
MADTKYGGLVVPKVLEKLEPWPTMEWIGEKDYGTDVTFMITRVEEPCIMEEFRTSRFDMYLTFFSYDPGRYERTSAEIEIGLGESGNAPDQLAHHGTFPGPGSLPPIYKRSTSR